MKMYSPPSKRSQLIKQTIVYTLMTLSVVVIVFILSLVVLGYRFNSVSGTLVQGGLVQFNSTPPGASLFVDSTRLGAATPTNATLTPGQHTITMSRTGYDTWRKTVEVGSGSILWLNYARLIPTDLPVNNVATFPAITSSIASPNRRFVAMTTDPSSPTVTLVDINGDTPKSEVITLPEGTYTVPEDKTGESFRLSEWDLSNRYLLLQHQYVDKTEWIVVDTENVNETVNLTLLFDIPMSGAKFSNSDRRVLYALMNGDVRRIDIDAATISAPLVRGVAEFSLYDRSIITYVSTIDAETKQRSVGYYHDGAEKPRVIKTYSDDGTVPLHLSVGKYYSRTYVAVAYGNTVDILQGSLPRSDSESSSSLEAVTTVTIPGGGVDYLSNKTNGRFFVAQHGSNYTVYDLELKKLTTTSLKGDAPPEGELRWLDGYTVWSSLGGMLRLYEFDGGYQHDIMPILSGQNPTLSPNGRYLYAPVQDENGAFHLSRVRLILQ